MEPKVAFVELVLAGRMHGGRAVVSSRALPHAAPVGRVCVSRWVVIEDTQCSGEVLGGSSGVCVCVKGECERLGNKPDVLAPGVSKKPRPRADPAETRLWLCLAASRYTCASELVANMHCVPWGVLESLRVCPT